jgi:hypothetical protein
MLARFGFSTSPEMDAIARKIVLERKDKASQFFIPAERITLEFEKMLLKSEAPSQGLDWIFKIGRLAEIFPELDLIVQKNNWSLFCQSLDMCSQDFDKPINDKDLRLTIQLTCISFWIPEKKSRLSFFKKLSFNDKIVRQALILSEKLLINLKLDDKVFLQLFAKEISPISIASFLILQNCVGIISKQEKVELIRLAVDLNVLHRPITPIINGHDLLQYINPGVGMRDVLIKAYKLQIKNPSCQKEDLLILLIKSLNL